MANDSAVLLWCDWKYEPEFRVIIEQAGFEVKNSIIWAKPNHGTGDLNGSFAPKHERIIFAAKGRPVFTAAGRWPDVQTGAEILNTEHPTPKPIDLIERLIVHLTYEKDIIVDPFNGSGATAIAAIRSKRVYYGTDLENKWIEETHDRVNKMLKDGY
jgi:site-specific DNA-methyltransferase (adenine-specific)